MVLLLLIGTFLIIRKRMRNQLGTVSMSSKSLLDWTERKKRREKKILIFLIVLFRYEAEKWANEFVEQEKARATQEEDDGWFEEFLTKEKELQVHSLKQITAKLSAIDDPKLQNSNFMSFVKGFSANNGAHPNSWTQEHQQQRRGGDWVRRKKKKFRFFFLF